MIKWDILILPHFRRVLKPLVKKHRDLFDEVVSFPKTFDAESATRVTEKVYKIRISPKSLKRGKSAGYRLFVYVFEVNKQLVPVTIYAKSEKQNLPLSELETHLEIIFAELSADKTWFQTRLEADAKALSLLKFDASAV